MARFKEQNVDIIIEKDAFNIFLKDLKDELEISKVFVIATSSLDQDKLCLMMLNLQDVLWLVY